MEIDQLSIDSNDLIPTSEELLMGGEDIDGIDLSENDEIFKQVSNEETASITISCK